MNITRSLSSKNEIKSFKHRYQQGEVQTEMIENLLQPFYEDRHPLIKQSCDFWSSRDPSTLGLLMIISQHRFQALHDIFGECDFKFQGNRTYKNHVLQYQNFCFIISHQSEVIVEPAQRFDDAVIRAVVGMKQELAQLTLSYILNSHSLDVVDQQVINTLKQSGVITHDGQIDFDYFLPPKASFKPK